MKVTINIYGSYSRMTQRNTKEHLSGGFFEELLNKKNLHTGEPVRRLA